jgi:hypothetical protein
MAARNYIAQCKYVAETKAPTLLPDVLGGHSLSAAASLEGRPVKANPVFLHDGSGGLNCLPDTMGRQFRIDTTFIESTPH